tara:strand:+ start:6174 stop:6587 length:414 start_codon:yes stop_codon:yes gene_type:complete
MAKKKFNETAVGKFLLDKIPNVVSGLVGGTPAGSLVRSLIGGSDMSQHDKEIAIKKLEQEIHEFDGITKRWVADSQSGSWLAVNVRPLTLVFFSLSYVLGWYLDYPLDNISGVLQLIVGAYFGSRGAEKVFGNKLHK